MKLNVTAFDHGHLQVVAKRSFWNYLHRVRLNTLDMATLADQGQTTTSLVTTENFSPRQASPRRDEDGTILVHTLHGSDWYIKKGGECSAGYG